MKLPLTLGPLPGCRHHLVKRKRNSHVLHQIRELEEGTKKKCLNFVQAYLQMY